jgi:ankyrin repeat protein
VHNVLHHSNTAQRLGCSQVAFIQNFSLSKWAPLNNTLQRYNIRCYSHSVSLLYLLAEGDMCQLISLELERVSSMDVPGERYGLPLLAAQANKNENSLRAMLSWSPQVKDNVTGDQLHISTNDIDEAVNILLTNDISIKWKEGENPMGWAAMNGYESVVKCLLATTKVNVNARIGRFDNAWQAATDRGFKKIAQMLIEAGADVNV